MTTRISDAGLIALAAITLGCGGRVSVGSPAATRESGAAAADSRTTISGRFHLVMGRDTFVAERYTRSTQRIDGEYTDRVRGSRVTYAAVLAPDGSVTRLETRTWVRGSSTATGDSTRVVTFAGDSLRVEENRRVRWVAGGAGAQLVLGPSGAFLEQLLSRAGRVAASRSGNPRDSVTFRVFEASGRRAQAITFRWTDDEHATVTGEDGEASFRALASGLLQAVIYSAPSGMRIVRAEATR